MGSAHDLTEKDIECLNSVASGKYRHVISAPTQVEAMVLSGLVSKVQVTFLPIIPTLYDYQLTLLGQHALESNERKSPSQGQNKKAP